MQQFPVDSEAGLMGFNHNPITYFVIIESYLILQVLVSL